ncbi:MAG: hypothetical protein HKN03_07350 [Acidimicrobiales bacterium]|nr:hypothetical protein [Acidimicrobiales bacterium]
MNNIVGKPQYGSTTLVTDPRASVLAYTVSQMLQRRQTPSATSPMESVAEAWERVLGIHRADFSLVAAPLVPPPGPLPEFDELVEEDLARRGVATGRLRGIKDKDREISETAAAVKLDTLRVDSEYAQLSQQSMLEGVWERLLDNEPDVVAGVLAIAFRDDEMATRALEVAGDCVVLELIAPSLDRAIPKKKPGVNRKGAASIVRASGIDRRDAYRQFVLGAALLAARESVAVAPGIEFVDVSVLTLESKADAVAGGTPKGLARFFITRSAIAHANRSLPADELVLSCAHASRISLGRRGGLRPVTMEYDKTDKQAITALLDPDGNDRSVRERVGQLTTDALSKSGEIGSKQLKRLTENGSAVVDSVRRRVSRTD